MADQTVKSRVDHIAVESIIVCDGGCSVLVVAGSVDSFVLFLSGCCSLVFFIMVRRFLISFCDEVNNSCFQSCAGEHFVWEEHCDGVVMFLGVHLALEVDAGRRNAVLSLPWLYIVRG